MKTIKTYLPVFTGFYNTLFEFDENDFCSENECEYDDLTIDYSQYEYDAVIEIMDFVESNCEFIKSIKFEKICSPKEYNFANDSANVTIEIKAREFKKYLNDNKEALNEYLKKRYTSCSGFISHYGNSFEEWKKETNNFVDLEGHYLGSLLDFYFENEEVNELDCYYFVSERVYSHNYITINEEA